MAGKPLTTAAIAMTEKKVDMSLDDIIKMSKNGTGVNKSKNQRIPNKNQKYSNNVVQDKSMKLRRFMDSRSALRQGALAQRRSNFQGNQFPLAAQAGNKAAAAPIHSRNFNQNQPMTSYRQRPVRPQFQNKSANGGFAVKQKQVVKVATKQRPQTMDSLFANMKEQRVKALSQQQNNNNTGRRNGGGQSRPGPPWTRYNH